MASTITNSVPVTAATCLKLRLQAGGVTYQQPIDVEIAESIATVKQKIEGMTGIPVQRQKWAVPGFGAITVEDDSNSIGSVLERNSHLYVQDSSPSASQPDNQGSVQGHQWQRTTVNQTDLHQGDTIDPGFYGQAPQGRGSHTFGHTWSNYGTLQQGDQYRFDDTLRHTQSNYGTPQQGDQYCPGEPAPPQDANPRRDRSPPNGGANAGGRQHRGNTYGRTTTRNTNHVQGDVIQAGWHGSAPANAGNHRFGVTVSEGGCLHQGNRFGLSASVGDRINTSGNLDKPSA